MSNPYMLVTMQYISTVYPLQGRNKLGAIFGGLSWPAQPSSWQLTESAPTRQAKFGQYLQEQAVEWEQISSNGQVLPMPA